MSEQIFVTSTGTVRIRRGPRGATGAAGAAGATGATGASGSGSIESVTNLIKGDGAGAGVDSSIVPADVIALVANNTGTNTGDQTNITGNAATVTTNANLTGDVTSSGNAATLANVPVTATFASDLTVVPPNDGGWTKYEVSTNDAYTGQTLQDIAELVSGTLSTGARYEIQAKVMFTTSADNTGIKVGIHGSGSGSAATALATITATSTSQSSANAFIIGQIDTASAAFLAVNSGTGIAFINGFVTTRSGGGPTISLQHLKVTSGTSTVLPGSNMRLRKCAH